MRIQHNIPGMRTLRYGRKLNNDTAKTLEKLSSGYCINRAGDDAAGLAVSERIRMSLTEFGRCKDNIQEGINLANTADAALQEVNDMLNRAQELCVAAANGTYSEHERDELQKELDALYSEVDRIFESSRFNEVELFRHEDYDYSNGRFEYVEKIIETSANDLQEWGVLEGIDKEFTPASPAMGATATLTLDSDVQDVTDLVGKSFDVTAKNGSSYTVKFTTTGSDNITSGSQPNTYYYNINVTRCSTVQDAFDKLCEASESWDIWVDNGIVLEEAAVDLTNRTVTFAFQTTTLSETIQFDNAPPRDYTTPGGNGESSNGIIVSSTQDKQLHPLGNTSTPTLTATASFELMNGQSALTDADKERLSYTSLYVDGHHIEFKSGISSDTVIDLNSITTPAELLQAIVTAINKTENLSAALDANGITVATSKPGDYAAIYEYYTRTISTNALAGYNVTTVQTASSEQAEITTITLPQSFTHIPFSVEIGGATYCFYDSSNTDFPADHEARWDGSVCFDVNGKGTDYIYSKIQGLVGSKYDATVTRSDNVITVTANSINNPLGVSFSGKASTMDIVPTNGFLLRNDTGNSYTEYFDSYNVSFDIASTVGSEPFTADKLLNRGFLLNGTMYQFSDSTSELIRADAVRVNIESCSTYEDIRQALQNAMPSHFVSYSNGVLTITGSNSSSNLSVQDGYAGLDGLFSENEGTINTETASNGKNVGHPSATIDFSKYNKDNFRELYGKGFRVTCSSCEGEYINVIFCYDKAQADFPDSFPHQYTDSEGKTVTRTIHNLAVELKDMDSGSDIVNAIVAQLTGELNHYTGVKRGSPSSVLEVFDRRPGNQPDSAQILSGVYTNCIYTVEEQFVPAPDAVLGDIEIDYRFVKIYTNSESDNEYIDIHLPYLTLENLKLNPPEPDLSTTETATETLERAKAANNVISYVRGTLGADCNRLEHAYADLAQAEEQAADAFSRIRDTDMAELMMEQTKLSILMQAQQAAQTHTMQQPQSVLKLMQ